MHKYFSPIFVLLHLLPFEHSIYFEILLPVLIVKSDFREWAQIDPLLTLDAFIYLFIFPYEINLDSVQIASLCYVVYLIDTLTSLGFNYCISQNAMNMLAFFFIKILSDFIWCASALLYMNYFSKDYF